MSSHTSNNLEEQGEAVEMKRERLEKAPAQKPEEPRGWQRMVGAFANNPLFEGAVRHGRKWRESEDPTDDEVTS